MQVFLQYLGKYAFMKRATRFGSSTSGTPLKRIDSG
ncbi:hypothetical protein T03_6378 [Trichinella britovi]|uniref:Uncharacterized protein n=1 Tax=Trichinella britovi TaxID=45882 RepID=A0A0V1C5I4_TRIBR|nr:hypothetical protein T03_2549 [Trichinella britovi]KRY44360.1 hypothetical protein T03_6378 [Trichinella britovi]